MLNRLRSLDRWASQSGERSSLVLWLALIAMAILTILGLLGVIWYTSPSARSV